MICTKSNSKTSNPGGQLSGDRSLRATVHRNDVNSFATNAPSGLRVCPHCGSDRLYLVRREIIVMVGDRGYRIVHDRCNPERGSVYADRDMRYSFSDNTVIWHYLCGEIYSQCPPFSIREVPGLERVVRRAAPYIEAHADAIRQAHLRADINDSVKAWGVMYDYC